MAKSARKSVAPMSAQTRWLAIFGALFVMVSFALLVRESFSDHKRVARISVRVDSVASSSHGFLVNITVVNTGDGTAASLNVEGVLTRSGQPAETSLVTVDYVAAGSERTAALFFSSDPRQGELVVRPKGYIEP